VRHSHNPLQGVSFQATSLAWPVPEGPSTEEVVDPTTRLDNQGACLPYYDSPPQDLHGLQLAS